MASWYPPPTPAGSALALFEQGELPRWCRVRQPIDATEVTDIPTALAAELARPEIGETIRPGMQVAITAGSRGIDRIAEVLRACADGVRARGATPFVVPAMGSHGGATAEGQVAMLAHLGVTEATLGCEIRASMETVTLGEVEGTPVHVDRIAFQADALLPVARVKPHTDFHGPFESGLMKMIAIGLGKQQGADALHREGMERFDTLIPAVGQFILEKARIPFGIALVENGFGRLSHLEAIPADRIAEREPELLALACARMARLPGERVDVLVVDEVGKDISGSGADSNVINRDLTGLLARGRLAPRPAIERIIYRDLTEGTEGNAGPICLADFVLRRLVDQIDPVSTYMNVITAKNPVAARLPIVAENDRQALHFAIASAQRIDRDRVRLMRIRNTKELEELWVSEALLDELRPAGIVSVLDELRPIAFDEDGMFTDSP